MPDQPIEDPRIWELIEACRPASDDLQDPVLAPLAEQLAANPELADLFERLQHLDASLAEAFRDVSVPEGLEDRVTTRLAAVRNGRKAATEDLPASESGAGEPVAEAAKPRRRFSRRWLLAGGAVAAVAASLVLAIVVPDRVPVLDRDEVLKAAKADFENWIAQGQLPGKSEPPADYPLSRDINVRQALWRPIDGFLGCQGVAYDLSLGRRGAPRATLYVVRATVPGLDNAPPSKPSSETGGWSVGAWQTDELLYVLVVQGGRRAYQRFLPRPTVA
ncbi:MAG TPA: hypothetical protein VMY37_39525 [Thermoguttaceae bacterium]|nr:hypothetical protein [Thermoguttaceae bacterium]